MNKPQKQRELGAPPLQAASLKEINWACPSHYSIYVVCFMAEGKNPSLADRPNLQNLLKQFFELFSEPNQLPPQRDIEHQIPLKDGTESINVWPYRYAYF